MPTMGNATMFEAIAVLALILVPTGILAVIGTLYNRR